MRNQRTVVDELSGQEWPTSNQERELHCLQHITDPVKVRRFDGTLFEHELSMNNEAVVVYVAQPVAHVAAIESLRRAGMGILLDDGIKILYVG